MSNFKTTDHFVQQQYLKVGGIPKPVQEPSLYDLFKQIVLHSLSPSLTVHGLKQSVFEVSFSGKVPI